MNITPGEVSQLASYIFEISGITLDNKKDYLVKNRLKPLLNSHNCATYQELYAKSRADKSETIKRDIIDAISTNETFFFRDNKPFDLLRNKIIPELIDRRQAQGLKKIPIRIWSAACSTGQEVYSIAMTLHDMLPTMNHYDISILGTDISSQAVERASYGLYNSFEIQRGLSKKLRHKYFTSCGNTWRIKDSIRSMARFKKINLLYPFDNLGRFDIVFCRNVAIYFTKNDKEKLFNNIAKVMVNGGALIIGGSENLTGIQVPLLSQQYLRTIYYSQWEGNDKLSPGQTTGRSQKITTGKSLTRTIITPSTPLAVKQNKKALSSCSHRPSPAKNQTVAPLSFSPGPKKKTSLLSQLTNSKQCQDSSLPAPEPKKTKSLLSIIAEKQKK